METKRLGGMTVKDADRGLVSAAFAAFNVIDADGDVTLPGAFDEGAEVVISAFGHGSWEGRLPVGKGRIRTTSTEAIMDGQFFMDTVHGRDTFTVVKELGALQEWSYSLHDVTSKMGSFDGRPVRFLQRIRVKETSPVLMGAGVGTRTLAIKATDDDHAELVRIKRDMEAQEAAQRAVLKREHERFVLNEARRRLTQMAELKGQIDAVIIRDRLFRRWYTQTNPPSVVIVRAALAVARASASELGIAVPVVKWFRDESADERAYRERFTRDWGGFSYPLVACTDRQLVGLADLDTRDVWIRLGRPLRDTLATVAHEVRHLAPGGDEAAARAYAKRWAESLPSTN